MTALSIQPTFPIFTDIDGQPLEAGYIFIGVANLAPIGNPINVYWDAALTLPAAQPIRTIGGYPVNAGTPARLYVNSDYSIQVQNRNGSVVYSAPAATERLSGVVIEIDSTDVSFIQAGAGAVTRTAQAKMRDVVSVKDFGATGDGVADDTAAIQAALNYCQTNGYKLLGAPGTYKISSTISIVCDADLGEMLIVCPGATVPVAVRIGTTTGTSSAGILDLEVVAPRVNNSSKTGLGWTGFVNSVGIELANLYASQITIGYVTNFGIGVRAGGYTQGFAHNTVNFGILFDNKISLLLQKQGASGFSNQNTYYGGQYGKSVAEGVLISGAYAIYLDDSTNNNTFVNPSVETEADLFQFYFNNSLFNTIINPRFEVADGGRVCFNATIAGGTQSNVFINGYSFNPPNFTYSGAGTSLYNKFVGQKYSDFFEYGKGGLAINNVIGSTASAPHITGFVLADQFMTKDTTTATDYRYKLYGDGLIGKRSTDTQPRMLLNWSAGKIQLGDGSNALTSAGFTGYPSANWVAVESAAAFIPFPDNSISLGTSGYRWTTVFATTGTINTSDVREKQDIAEIDEAERRVAAALKGLVKKFRWKDAVQAKGDGARIHVGVIAQEVMAAFEAEALDPMCYAIVCYDEWDAMPEELGDNGEILRAARPAGNRYGIRYDQLLAFIIAAL